MSRSTRLQVNARVLAVLELRLAGAEPHDLRRYASAEGWNVSDRQIERYVAAVDEACKRSFDAEADALLARHVLQRRRVCFLAMQAGDFRAALAAMKDEAKLEGLYPPARHEARHEVAATARPRELDLKDLTDEELTGYLDIVEAATARKADSAPPGTQPLRG